MLKSFPANYPKKVIKKWKYCLLAPILPEKWRDLTWLHIVPKFNTCTTYGKYPLDLKCPYQLRNWVLKIYMLNQFNDIIFWKVIKVRLFFKNLLQKLFGKVICLFIKGIFSVFLRSFLYLNITNTENTFHALSLT